MKIKFPENFLWGAATSGPQSEGSKDKPHLNVMDKWFQLHPEDFHNQVGPEITCNSYEKYPEDIELMQRINLNSFRTSIQWSRLIDDLETGTVNQKALKYYRDYFSRLKKANIKLMVNLYHFDMPWELQEVGGFANKHVVDLFALYAKRCFESFGDLVDMWSTMNEPIVPVEAQYLYKWWYPYISDYKLAAQVGYNTILAHAKAVKEFKILFANDSKKEITVVLNLTPSYSKDDKPENIKAAKLSDEFFNKSMLEAAVNGRFNQEFIDVLKADNVLPEFNKSELDIIANNRIDFLAVNYYQPRRIQGREKPYSGENMPDKHFENFDWAEKRINPHRGWEIHPETIYNIAMDIKNNYNNIKWFISENGMGVEGEEKFKNQDGVIQDDYRIDFIKEHLYWLHKAIQEGSNCFGYQMWTFIDCWSWANSFKNRYGFVSLDLKTQARTIKKSGTWISNCIINNEFEIEENLVNKN
ncbi:6-phospho-beta-glucosidase [Spiroplasma sabaudiense Ar-1343]|uniref:6-phospho-beta-glucosidase n=1 Tax=Spiroplasma sabaudiense Ar-1343 TaxID=1276257 RepID=W6A8N5_9MOLU|nr:glycoside hydrolase family 1 protein [Spiroplasma sabaudiense]AHI53528.1 6-phospho-beta-glucosidase [Spiroplasma sabaudiense Ar-1343]